MWLLDHTSGLWGIRWQEFPDEELDPNQPISWERGITEGSARQPGNSIAVLCAGSMWSLSLDCEDKTCDKESKERVLIPQSCPTLCDPMDCSLPGSSVHRILQARILDWVAIPFFRESSHPRFRTQVFCIAGDSLLSKPPRKPAKRIYILNNST